MFSIFRSKHFKHMQVFQLSVGSKGRIKAFERPYLLSSGEDFSHFSVKAPEQLIEYQLS